MNTFEQDVKAYTAYAAKFDTPIRQMFVRGDRREAIQRIAGAYRVAWNFPRRFDEGVGVPRYEPVVRLLAAYSPNIGINPVEAVLGLTRDLQQIYSHDKMSNIDPTPPLAYLTAEQSKALRKIIEIRNMKEQLFWSPLARLSFCASSVQPINPG